MGERFGVEVPTHFDPAVGALIQNDMRTRRGIRKGRIPRRLIQRGIECRIIRQTTPSDVNRRRL